MMALPDADATAIPFDEERAAALASVRLEEAFSRRLAQAFDLEPLEDGYSHPAEQIIADALQAFGATAFTWLAFAYFEQYDHNPSVAAGLIRCLGRLSHDSAVPWARFLALSGLYHGDVEVREAAVRAFEMWGGQQAIEALTARVSVEPTPWLADYARQVIADLAA
jgi:hypothetical protein